MDTIISFLKHVAIWALVTLVFVGVIIFGTRLYFPKIVLEQFSLIYLLNTVVYFSVRKYQTKISTAMLIFLGVYTAFTACYLVLASNQ